MLPRRLYKQTNKEKWLAGNKANVENLSLLCGMLLFRGAGRGGRQTRRGKKNERVFLLKRAM